MQKVYKLLRNNQETGPYSLEEILQLNLKAFDLVWVDGRSAAWRYPSEIDALKPYVPEVPKASTTFEPVSTADMDQQISQPLKTESTGTVSKKVFVSLPGKAPQVPSQIYQSAQQVASSPVEQKATELQQKIQSFAEAHKKQEPVLTNYSRSFNEVEEDYTKWVYQQKTKKKKSVSKKDLGIAAIIIALITGGYFILSKPSVVQPIAAGEAKPSLPLPEKETTQANVVDEEVSDNTKQQTGVPAITKSKTNTEKKKTTTNSSTQSSNTVVVENTTNETGTDASEKMNETGVVTETTQPGTSKENSTTEGKQKKKKFGEVVKGIFTKKEKKETAGKEETLEEPKPANNRQSTRRTEQEEKMAVPDNSVLAGMVDITSNAPDNWMMGISGLKVTLRNRNNVALQTASVQVLYYDENNQLLEKKTIYFNNVPAKGKLTMAAPDHKFADHVDFKLAAVSAKEDRYASN